MSRRNRWEGASKYCKYGIKMLGDIPDINLPDGWIGVYHISGGIVYLHRESRVVTWSRPYIIPKGTSLRKHNMPLTAIPCLHQKRAMDECDSNAGDKRPFPHDSSLSTKIMKVENGHGRKGNHGMDDAEESDAGKGNEFPQIITVNEVCMTGFNGNVNEVPSINNDSTKSEKQNENGSAVECGSDDSLLMVESGKRSEKVGAEKICTTTDEVNRPQELHFNADLHHNTLTNGHNESQVASCPFGFGKSQKRLDMKGTLNDVHNLIDSPTGTDLCYSNGTDSPAEISLPSSNCYISPTESDPRSDGTNFATEIELLGSTRSNSPMEVDFLRGNDNSENVDNPHEVTPASLHTYLAKIFEFRLLTKEQLTEPVFVCPDYQEITDEIEKKLSTVGKTPFQVLNEYCQRELKTLPILHQVERHSQHDFTVEILIKNLKFGIANGDTMRAAKHGVASITLNIMDYTVLNDHEPSGYVTVFDKIPILDKSVILTIEEFSPLDLKYPYETLLLFLARNFPGFNEPDIELTIDETEGGGHQEYKMKYKDYNVIGKSENAKYTKEVAAQAFIGVLYPQLKNWGSVIRLTENYMELVDERDIDKKGMKPKKCIMHVLRQEMHKIAKNLVVG